MLKLMGRVTSINVRKVTWALDELGLAYDREDWGLPLRDPHDPAFLALNPNAQVPVLVEGEFVLWESNAILIYLSERERALVPERLEQRALVWQWLSWQSSELNPSWGYAVQALIRKVPGVDDPARIAAAMTKWGTKNALLARHLADGREYVAGDMFSIADIALGLSVHRWLSIPAAKPDFPELTAYHERLKGRVAGARWMSDATP